VQVFTREGHRWPLTPGLPGSQLLSSVQVGGLEAITAIPEGGAGGVDHLTGEFLYGDHREPYREAGLWGLFRVHPRCSQVMLQPLGGGDGCGTSQPPLIAAVGGVVILASLILLTARRMRPRRA